MEGSSSFEIGPFLTNDHGDRYLFPINHSVFNRLGSEAVYDATYGNSLFEKERFYIILGTDSGLLIDYIQKKGVPRKSKYLFVELPEVLERLTEVIDFNNLPSEIDVVAAPGLVQKLYDFDFLKYIYIDSLFVIESLACIDSFLTAYHTLSLQTKKTIEAISFEEQAKVDSRTFTIHQLNNVTENQISASLLNGAFQGKMALLLGGGPSLDQALPWIKKNRNSFVLLSVSRICRRLKEADIIPDIVFNADPNWVSYAYSKELFYFAEESLFINLNHSNSMLLGQWTGRKAYIGPLFPWKSPLNVEDYVPVGPTVSHVALAKAIEMGFSTILLSGVDLCHKADGQCHTKGSPEDGLNLNYDFDLYDVTNYKGETVFTTKHFALGIEHLGKIAKKTKDLNIDIINTSAEAAFIEDIRHENLDSIYLPSESIVARDIWSQLIPENNSALRLDHYSKVKIELERIYTALKKIQSLVFQAQKASDSLFSKRRSPDRFKFKKKLDTIENTLNNEYAYLVKLVKSFEVRDFFKAVYSGSEDWTDSDVKQMTILYYKAYAKSVSELLKVINNCLTRVNVRLEEEAENPDFDLIFQQWIKDKQFGRFKLFKPLSQDDLIFQKQSTNDFFTDIRNQFSVHMQPGWGYPTADVKTIDGAHFRGKIRTSFKSRSEKDLLNIIKQLDSSEDIKGTSLKFLAEGHCLELHGQTNAALESYQKVLADENSPVLEDALNRIVSLSLEVNNFDDARLGLEYLSGISDNYLIPYADLLWIVGERFQSLDLYAVYLGKVPNDINVMLKLAQYYLELNSLDGAKMAVSHVLSLEPDNSLALNLVKQIADKKSLQ